jgi:hypothetical protein
MFVLYCFVLFCFVSKLALILCIIDTHIDDPWLQNCANADKMLVENLLRLAQTELLVLNLASTTIVTGSSYSVRTVLLH